MEPTTTIRNRDDAGQVTLPTMALRTFVLIRDHDVTGISGTGPVADGVVFPDGSVAMRWRDLAGDAAARGVRPTTVMHESIESVEALHSHGVSTRVVWGAETSVCQHCGRVIGAAMPATRFPPDNTWVHTEGRQRYLVRCNPEDTGQPYGLDATPTTTPKDTA